MLNLKVMGYKEAVEILGQLNEKMQRQMLRTALRRASKPILQASKERVPVKSGKLRSKLRIVAMRQLKNRKSETSVAVKPYFGTNKKQKTINEFYGRFVHFGTAERKSPKGKMLRFEADGKVIYTRKTKAMPGRPFLEEGFSVGHQQTVDNFGTELATSIEAFVNKNFKPIQ